MLLSLFSFIFPKLSLTRFTELYFEVQCDRNPNDFLRMEFHKSDYFEKCLVRNYKELVKSLFSDVSHTVSRKRLKPSKPDRSLRIVPKRIAPVKKIKCVVKLKKRKRKKGILGNE